jgi:hypothetical protein
VHLGVDGADLDGLDEILLPQPSAEDCGAIVDRVRMSVGDMKVIRDILLGRLQDDGIGNFS